MILTGSPNPSHDHASSSSHKKDRRRSYRPRRFGNISRHTENQDSFVQLSESVHCEHEAYEMSRPTVTSGGNVPPVSKIGQAGVGEGTCGGINVRNDIEVGWSQV